MRLNNSERKAANAVWSTAHVGTEQMKLQNNSARKVRVIGHIEVKRATTFSVKRVKSDGRMVRRIICK